MLKEAGALQVWVARCSAGTLSCARAHPATRVACAPRTCMCACAAILFGKPDKDYPIMSSCELAPAADSVHAYMCAE